MYVRYAYAPISDPNLINSAGLPAVPFSSETWNYNVSITTGLNNSTTLNTNQLIHYSRKAEGIVVSNNGIDEIMQVQLSDTSGRLLNCIKINSSSDNFFIPILKKGVYLLHGSTNKSAFSHKLIF